MNGEYTKRKLLVMNQDCEENRYLNLAGYRLYRDNETANYSTVEKQIQDYWLLIERVCLRSGAFL
jgi:hypothetical protein